MSRGTAIRAARRAAAAAAAAEEAAAEEAAAAEEEEGGCCWLDRKLLALTLIGLLPPLQCDSKRSGPAATTG